jgi:hypothetical protein
MSGKQQIKGFTSNEIEVTFDRVLSSEEWDELFKESKKTVKCNGKCVELSGGKPCNGSDGQCNHCGFKK